jgi:hypothetical protein
VRRRESEEEENEEGKCEEENADREMEEEKIKEEESKEGKQKKRAVEEETCWEVEETGREGQRLRRGEPGSQKECAAGKEKQQIKERVARQDNM